MDKDTQIKGTPFLTEDNLRLVFYYTEFNGEKISLICERDRLFQQYIDTVKSLETWSAKQMPDDLDTDGAYNFRRNKRRILEHLTKVKSDLTEQLLKLDSELSPFELV
jgi:hypothetical protein